MLDVKRLARKFGAVEALAGLDFSVREGESVGLIGPNGSGKTTLFNVVTGVYPATSGSVHLGGRDIGASKPDRIVNLGVARTFQNLRIFERLTVFENVWAAQHRRADVSLRELMFANRAAEQARREEIDGLLELAGLADRRDTLAGGLPLPDQRRLELARALARRPRLLLLDEPAGGMTPAETEQMVRLICDIAIPGRTCIVIEHKMELIRILCDRVCVLDFGRKIAEGSPDAVLRDERVIEAYIGREALADA